jgi:hypothetical protein
MSLHVDSARAPWEPEGWPDDYVPCCYGSANDGPRGCTCWQAVYDIDQQPAFGRMRSPVRGSLCADCAYRPGSPERQTSDGQELLEELAWTGVPFFCHQGRELGLCHTQALFVT